LIFSFLQTGVFGHGKTASGHAHSSFQFYGVIIGKRSTLKSSNLKLAMMRDIREPVRRFYKLLCTYKNQPEELYAFLLENMRAVYFARREILYPYRSVISDAVFVSSGFLLAYGFNSRGHRQLLQVLPAGSILLSKSFIHQSPTSVEVIALADTYVIFLNHADWIFALRYFEDAELLAMLIISDYSQREQLRLLGLSEKADKVIQDFYSAYPEFLAHGFLLDLDISSYLLIGEQTLRNVRMKLFREGRL